MKEDFEVDGDLGFEPAVPATGADTVSGTGFAAVAPSGSRPARRGRRRGLRRTFGAAAVLATALMGTGVAYAAFATSSGASDTSSSAQDIAAGKQLYEVSCITCHGANLQGVEGRGVPLVGVGAASVYFQVSTGRMPGPGQGAYIHRKKAKFDEKQTEQLAAYVQSVGGGPVVPQGTLRDKNVAEGGELFRLNCASCHGNTFAGAPLSAGKIAPSLKEATDKQIYTAMLSGPENMPVFSDNTLTPEQKRQIISYVQTLKASQDPGGNGIDRIGPVSEAIVLWVAGVGALGLAILWIGAKSQ